MDMERISEDTRDRLDASSVEVLPDYLVKHYSWAYLWPSAVWFFDHQPIINAILFGNYRKIMDNTLRMMRPTEAGKTLQIAAVYGELTPKLAQHIDELYLMDAANVQLRAAARKLDDIGRSAFLARMHAETLHYDDDSFDTSLMFLLLHEMPEASRRKSLAEAMRVTRRGGRFVIAEYGECSKRHFFHRFAPMRWVLTWAEPFLGGFWSESLNEKLASAAASVDKKVELEEHVDIFGGFYRVASYRVK
ncbi:MAG: rhodoquinone biosynthesis methyltransferase RquA [Gammaproteobacteria bacterium]|nr:rhodoquinone biosynthesis methyltransferase RquA [Gammaproteobacteria bacterium]